MEDSKKTQRPRYKNLDVKVALDKIVNKLEIAEENIREIIHNEMQKEKEMKNSVTEP